MIRNAYQLQEYQIVGGPDWINDDRFDITAKAANSDTPPLQLLAMAQTLLADRFKLRVHRETREVPVYALVMARDDCRLGPRLQKAAADCDALMAALGRGGAPPPPAPAGERPPCGIRQVPGRMMAGGSLLSDVGRNLAPSTGRPRDRSDRAYGTVRPGPRVDARPDAPTRRRPARRLRSCRRRPPMDRRSSRRFRSSSG